MKQDFVSGNVRVNLGFFRTMKVVRFLSGFVTTVTYAGAGPEKVNNPSQIQTFTSSFEPNFLREV